MLGHSMRARRSFFSAVSGAKKKRKEKKKRKSEDRITHVIPSTLRVVVAICELLGAPKVVPAPTSRVGIAVCEEAMTGRF